jgi:Flp pilus assembly pilin Flp
MTSLWRDERGQASVEYMLMISITLAMTISVIKKFVQPILAEFANTYATKMQNALFNKANMHTLRIGRGH